MRHHHTPFIGQLEVAVSEPAKIFSGVVRQQEPVGDQDYVIKDLIDPIYEVGAEQKWDVLGSQVSDKVQQMITHNGIHASEGFIQHVKVRGARHDQRKMKSFTHTFRQG